MNLTYRGIQYNATATRVDVVEAPIAGQYRGATVHIYRPINLSTFQRVLHLVYRGVPFNEAIAIPTA